MRERESKVTEGDGAKREFGVREKGERGKRVRG